MKRRKQDADGDLRLVDDEEESGDESIAEEELIEEEEDDDDDLAAAADDPEARRKVLERIAEDEARGDTTQERQAWDPRQGKTEEELECDPRAYAMLHRLDVEWPCLSLDIIADERGGGRTVFPHELTLACGTQAGEASANRLNVVRVSNLGRVEIDDPDEDDDRYLDDDADESSTDPTVGACCVPHPGSVNRVACFERLAATWSEDGHVRVWDLAEPLRRLADGARRDTTQNPVATLGSDDEGYAVAWARDGRLATGDNAGAVKTWHLDRPTPATTWRQRRAVEDVAWSPAEDTVLIAVGGDQALRVYDTRAPRGAMISAQNAHAADINSLAWNRAVSYLVATAGDDGILKVWDLRAFGGASTATTPDPVGCFAWHEGNPISSVQWDPHDESALVLAAADNTVTLWDLSVEDDHPAPREGTDDFLSSVPPQLLFIHQGLTDPKEVKYHPQIPRLLLTTAADGLSFFIPALEGKPR
ncbi:hypothetical protein CTAYLR_000844 [Chrysophaeum taylorii]|uniref:Glutamate-rich WD repeat-containing protein 1 n=1 Tax=Chrysophaeum taylorii TaxID=2483200 RepID=A0AAD7UR40_9STRA|nr:hypothetical protein CTAYLR_000844 [Chrysophaeum taylorii]